MSITTDGRLLLQWPCDAPHKLTQGYWNNSGTHRAIDIAIPTVQSNGLYPIYAADDGIVDQIQYWDGKTITGMQSYGNMVRLTHAPYKNYSMQTRYAHLKKILVKQGQQVKRGDIIGYMGTTGHSTGIHLHFETIWNGNKVQPLDFLTDDFTNKYKSVANGTYTSVIPTEAVVMHYINAGPMSPGDFKKYCSMFTADQISYTTK